MTWVTPRTWVAGELVDASKMNHLRDLFRAIGEWSPGDLKMTYKTHANATTTTLTEPEEGWFVCNGASYSSGTYPVLHAALGSPNPAVLPDYRGRVFVAPGTQDSHAFARGESGGEYDHVLTEAEMPTHAHSVTDPGHSHTIDPTWMYGSQGGVGQGNTTGASTAGTQSAVTGISLGNTGGGNAHATMPPYLVGGMILVKRDW